MVIWYKRNCCVSTVAQSSQHEKIWEKTQVANPNSHHLGFFMILITATTNMNAQILHMRRKDQRWFGRWRWICHPRIIQVQEHILVLDVTDCSLCSRGLSFLIHLPHQHQLLSELLDSPHSANTQVSLANSHDRLQFDAAASWVNVDILVREFLT